MNKVTAVVDKTDCLVQLQQHGSGSNWVGVHLIAYFALQKYFTQSKRLVPRFLFMDHPSQVNFPSKTEGKDTDREIFTKMYDFMYNKVNSLSNQLQVIVVDHAKLYDNHNFKASVIEDWHTDLKLIPIDWYE
ncbi:hypothetical protein IGJ02_002137 [Enterococcus sp. DIV0724b]